jgi:predicted O-linked N-acetylglucosamine transferase (SPINDLY family)
MKLNDAVIAVWGRILRALPQARLHVQNDALAYAGARARLQARLEAAGIAASRVTMAGSVPREAYLRAHAGIDMILDTFPYSGATTTCEALWMGVPTLTLAGDTLVSRQGASLLTCVGLAGWIAVGEDDYVQRAIALASNLESLAALRSRLRDQLVASPLCDAPRFARNLEQALLTMWEQGAARHPAPKTVG